VNSNSWTLAELFEFSTLAFQHWMTSMFWQLAIMVAILMLLTWSLRNRASARFRYAMWLLVPLRLVLPPTFALIFGWGWWCLPSQSSSGVPFGSPDSTLAVAPDRELIPAETESTILSADEGADSSIAASESLPGDRPAFVAGLLDGPPGQSADRVGSANNDRLAINETGQRPDLHPASGAQAVQVGKPAWPGWPAMMVGVWMAGFCFLMARFVVGLLQVRAIVCQAMPANRSTRETAHHCRKETGLKKPVRMLVSPEVATPMLVGVIRPVILLPVDCDQHLTGEELESVLVHEMQHVARRDPLVHFSMSLLVAVYWFHPAAWVAQWQLRRLRELACDEATIASLSNTRKAYASGLVKVAELISSKHPIHAVGFIERKKEMTNRVMRILDSRTRVGRGISLVGLFAILAIGLVIIPGAGKPEASTVVPVRKVDDSGPFEISPSRTDHEPQASIVDKQRQEESRSEEEIAASRPYEPMVQVAGAIVDQKDKPVASASVTVRFWQQSHSFKTNDEGRFRFDVPKSTTAGMLVTASNFDGSMQASLRVGWQPEPDEYQSLKLKLLPSRSFVVEVQDQQGNAVPDVKVGCINGYSPFALSDVGDNGRATIQVPSNLDVEFLFALSKSAGADYHSYVLPRDKRKDKNAEKPAQPNGIVKLTLATPVQFKIAVKDQEGRPITHSRVSPSTMKKPGQADSINLTCLPELISSQTDENGIATFAWIPDWPQHLSFSFGSDDYSYGRVAIKPGVEERDFGITVAKKVAVNGRVQLPDGSPATGLSIRFHGRGLKAGESSGTSGVGQVYTDDQGKFQMKIAPHQAYLGFTQDKKLKFESPVVLVVGDSFEEGDLDLTVRPGTRVFGKVVVKGSDKPLTNHSLFISHFAKREIPIDGGQGTYHARPAASNSAETNESGEFEFFAGAGEYSIRGSNQKEPVELSISDQKEVEVNFDLDRPQSGTLVGRVVDPSGKALKGVEIQGIYAASGANGFQFKASTNAEGEFKVERELLQSVVRARTEDGKFAAIIEIGPDDATLEIELAATIPATGRLVDAEGKPLADKKIKFGRYVYMGEPGSSPFMTCFGTTVPTDEKGVFTLNQLVPEAKYDISVVTKEEDGMEMGWHRLLDLVPEVGQANLELGDVTYVPRVPYKAPTLEERIAKAFGVEGQPVTRMDNAKTRATLTRQLILVLFADSSSSAVKQFSELQYEDAETRNLLFGFLTMAIESTNDDFESANALADRIGLNLNRELFEPMLAVVDVDGKTIASAPMATLFEEEGDEAKISKTRLHRFLTEHTPRPLDGRKLLEDALAEAKRDGKRVIIQETATWCGPCLVLSRFLDKHRAAWVDDYIWIKMDHRWAGAREIMAELRDGAEGGIPWTAILDEDGMVLATSNLASGENVGFPSTEPARAHFKSMLMNTKIRLTDAQVNQLVGELKPK